MSVYKIIITEKAIRDIRKIYNYIEENVANKAVKKIYNDIQDLEFMPRIHKTVFYYLNPEIEYRRIISGKYIIIYKIVKNQITILRIFNHKQDYLNSHNFILKEKSEKYEIKNKRFDRRDFSKKNLGWR